MAPSIKTFNHDISQWDVSKVTNMKNMFRVDFYTTINSEDHFSFDDDFYFSYDKLVAAFFHQSLVYINKFKQECIPFELFDDISKNTDKFNFFLLVNNEYIVEEYLKLSIEEKELLIQDQTMKDFFNEIQLVLNIKSF